MTHYNIFHVYLKAIDIYYLLKDFAYNNMQTILIHVNWWISEIQNRHKQSLKVYIFSHVKFQKVNILKVCLYLMSFQGCF